MRRPTKIDGYYSLAEAANVRGITKQAICVSIANGRILSEKIDGFRYVKITELKRYVDTIYDHHQKKDEEGELLFEPSKGKYSTAQLSKALKVDRQFVYYWLRQGYLRYERKGSKRVIHLRTIEDAHEIIRPHLEKIFNKHH